MSARRDDIWKWGALREFRKALKLIFFVRATDFAEKGGMLIV